MIWAAPFRVKIWKRRINIINISNTYSPQPQTGPGRVQGESEGGRNWSWSLSFKFIRAKYWTCIKKYQTIKIFVSFQCKKRFLHPSDYSWLGPPSVSCTTRDKYSEGLRKHRNGMWSVCNISYILAVILLLCCTDIIEMQQLQHNLASQWRDCPCLIVHPHSPLFLHFVNLLANRNCEPPLWS